MAEHLTADGLWRLLAGEWSPAREAALFAHLQAGDCEACQAVLAELSDEQEQQLLALAARAGQENPADRVAERQALLDRLPDQARRWGFLRGKAWAVGIALAAAGLLAVWWLPRPVTPESTGRIKAASPASVPGVGLALKVGRVHGDTASAASVTLLRSGSEMPAGDSLVFEVHSRFACWLYLIRIGLGDAELLLPGQPGQEVVIQPGRFSPQSAGQPLGFSTVHLSGRQRFVCLCLDEKPDDHAALLRAASDLATIPVADLRAWDVFEVQLREQE